jgi:membrane protease YdiL (CAAX protease family)
MLMHPGELLAAAVWFSMISLLAWHTKNLWECIAAHSATNLILGIYVLTNGAWWLV